MNEDWDIYHGVTVERIICCDCGLVHEIEIRGNCRLRWIRDERATAQIRRHQGGELQKENGLKYKMVRKNETSD